MGKLGDFGTQRDKVEDTFGYFGETVRVHPDLTDLALLEIGRTATSMGPDTTGGEAIGFVFDLVRSLVHPDDFDTFWKLAKSNRQTVEDLTNLSMGLIEAVTERPTEQPSSSSAGPASTGTRSGVDSSLRVQRDMEAAGRPDLALVVQEVREHRASA